MSHIKKLKRRGAENAEEILKKPSVNSASLRFKKTIVNSHR